MFHWPKGIILGVPGDDIRLSIELLQFYNDQQNVSSANNTLIVGNTTASLDAGWYTTDTLVTALNDAFINDDVLVAFDSTTYRFTLAANSSVVIDSSSTLLETIGFVAGTEYIGTNITAPNVCDLGGATSIDVVTSLKTSNVQDTQVQTSTLGRVPITADYGQLQTYQGMLSWSTLADHLLTHLSVRFEDNEGDTVVFTKGWSLTLYFQNFGGSTYNDMSEVYFPPDIAKTNNGSELARDRTESTKHSAHWTEVPGTSSQNREQSS